MYDYYVVGAGFSGAAIANGLARWGKHVMVVDRRSHIGGTAYDEKNEHGILVGKYGPHILHFNDARTFQYLHSFGQLVPYKHRVLARVSDRWMQFPINCNTVNEVFGENLHTADECREFMQQLVERKSVIRNSEDYVVSRAGRKLFDLFYRWYTWKHWGREPKELDAEVLGRTPIRYDFVNDYYVETHQYVPRRGYAALVANMLDHENITVQLDTDFNDLRGQVPDNKLVYTGPLDELFGYEFGPLPFRGVEFKEWTYRQTEWQPAAVTNHPSLRVDYTRVTEFKHFPFNHDVDFTSPVTSVVFEFPFECERGKGMKPKGDPLYPIPQPKNFAIQRKYEELARKRGIVVEGRLGRYAYRNIHEVTPAALRTCALMLQKEFGTDLKWHDVAKGLVPVNRRTA